MQASPPGRGPAPPGPPGATVEAGLGPVGLGHRDQLGDLEAVGGGVADQGGGDLMVAVAVLVCVALVAWAIFG